MARLFCSLLALLMVVSAPSVRAAQPVAVVELFTSQGCSSCPPADAFLGELAKRNDVLAFSEHVDYWDYLGWKDPFASVEASERQRAYARRFELAYVYTPQMVIGGQAQVTGSNRHGVLAEVREQQSRQPVAIDIQRLPGERFEVTVGEQRNAWPSDVWLVFYDREQSTDIRRGENGGRRLRYSNVVRSFVRIGSWSGAPATLSIDMNRMAGLGEACAVLVQQEAAGRIYGAARLELAASPEGTDRR